MGGCVKIVKCYKVNIGGTNRCIGDKCRALKFELEEEKCGGS